jgi:Family of unknown function (DUF6455)
MTERTAHQALWTIVVNAWQKHREYVSDIEMLSHLDATEREAFAADIGVGVDELLEDIRYGEGADELLDRMMKARGLARKEVRLHDFATMREIESTCSRCRAKSRCAHELDAGTAVANAAQFCPNALLMAALAREFGETRTLGVG